MRTDPFRNYVFALLASLSMATALHAQSLADVAKKAEEERAKRAEKEQVKPDKTEKADSANKAGKTEKADKADNKSKKVYTNADLPGITSTTSTAPAPSVTPASEPAGPVPTETAEMKAKRVLAFELDRLAFKMRDWSISVNTTLKMCDPGSYLGLRGGSLEGHRQFCRDQVAEVDGKRANINQLVVELESTAAREGIAPGVARDLVKAMGWK